MLPQDEAEYLRQLADTPESYATVIDHHREMARRFAESRDALKHRCRELEAQRSTLLVQLRTLRDQLRKVASWKADEYLVLNIADELDGIIQKVL